MRAQAEVLPLRVEQDAQWRELYEQIVHAGLLKKQLVYYTQKTALILGMLGLSLTCLIAVDVFWVHMVNALVLAVVFAQIGLLAHASGHGQIFASRCKNQWLSRVLGLLIGLSAAWWDKKHNRDHHSNPNNLAFDQDVNVSVLAFTKEQALKKKGLFRFVTAYQHIFFLPALFLEALSIRLDSLQYLLFSSRRRVNVKRGIRAIELGGMCTHIVGYALLLAFFLESWATVVAFLAVHQALFGFFLGLLFATNHKGMEMLEGKTARGYLWTQVPTTRNVKNPPFWDWWSGGLNFQIEHHLFPNMPENKLREARAIVKQYCDGHAIPYREMGVLATYICIVLYLKAVSACLRESKRVSS